jgi:hypothetical protein
MPKSSAAMDTPHRIQADFVVLADGITSCIDLHDDRQRNLVTDTEHVEAQAKLERLKAMVMSKPIAYRRVIEHSPVLFSSALSTTNPATPCTVKFPTSAHFPSPHQGWFQNVMRRTFWLILWSRACITQRDISLSRIRGSSHGTDH